MRAEMFLRFVAAIVVGWLGAVTSSLGQTQETMALVPIDDHYYGKIYDKLVSACTASLISAAGKAGVNATRASWSAADSKVINSATYRIYVGTNWALQQEHYFNLWSEMAALDLPSAFSGPEQFASFMTETPAYRRLLKESGENSKGRPNLYQLVGISYGSAVHVTTSDQPLQRPEDLAARMVFQINPSLFSIAEQSLVQHALGAKSEQPLASSSKMMGQREKNANNTYYDDVGLLKQDGFNPINRVLSTPNRFFVLMPTTLLRDAVPKPFRRFISLTATEIVQVWFLLVGGNSLTSEQIARIDKIADDAALDCSGRNFNLEKSELAALQADGSSVTQLNVSRFYQSSLDKQKGFLDQVRGDPVFTKDIPDIESTIAAFKALGSDLHR
jgi:hypothetical protein